MVSGADLSIMKNNGQKADFDSLSDEKLKGLKNNSGAEQITFMWHNTAGFVRT